MSYELFRFVGRTSGLLVVALLLLWNLKLMGQELPVVVSDSLTAVSSDTIPTALSDSLNQESVEQARKPFFRWEDKPDPKKALIFSFIVPGAGQIYNRKWWKAPIIYVGIGAIAYAIDFNTTEYLQLRLAYKRHQKGLPHLFSGTSIDNANTLRNFRDSADKNRQLAYFGMGGFFLLSGIEAFVDAHLYTFDISDDLSMKLKPSLQSAPGGTALGIGLQIQLP